MRNIIFGGIGVVWGGGVVLYSLLSGSDIKMGNGAYAGGRIGGIALGVLLFIVGAYYLFLGFQNLGNEPEPKRRTKKKKPKRRDEDDEEE